jgi:hypothetical protein
LTLDRRSRVHLTVLANPSPRTRPWIECHARLACCEGHGATPTRDDCGGWGRDDAGPTQASSVILLEPHAGCLSGEPIYDVVTPHSSPLSSSPSSSPICSALTKPKNFNPGFTSSTSPVFSHRKAFLMGGDGKLNLPTLDMLFTGDSSATTLPSILFVPW